MEMGSEVENGKSISASTWDDALVTSVVQSGDLSDLQDVMVRRMKNRERQRRYRARKRLEADRMRTNNLQQLPYPEALKAISSMSLPKVKNHVVTKTKMDNAIVPFSPNQVEAPVNGSPVDFVTRVHSQRDWKRDARRAHLMKEQNGGDSTAIVPLATPASESQAQSISFGGCHSNNPVLEINQERTVPHGRRNWKEEARNKKS